MCLPEGVNQQILSTVRECFAEALGLEEDEVEWGSRVIDDLGAESLDLLDIVYRLERAFDIRIPRGGIESTGKEGLEEGEEYEVNGILTDRAVEKLAEAMPEVPRDEFQPGMKAAEVPLLFRVGTFYNLVVRLLAEKDSASG